MQFAHNGYYKGSTPLGLKINSIKKKINLFFYYLKGIWSSLVYGARLENEYFTKVVSSNLTVPVIMFIYSLAIYSKLNIL